MATTCSPNWGRKWQMQTEIMASYQGFCTIVPRTHKGMLDMAGLLDMARTDLEVTEKWIDTQTQENRTQWWAHISIAVLTHVLSRMPLNEETVVEIMEMTKSLQLHTANTHLPPPS